MNYFDDDDTRPLLADVESESENMTSYVIVVNNCKGATMQLILR